jgi:hypothetical protein
VASGGVAQKAGFTVAGEGLRDPEAPAEVGVERRWRLTRDQYVKRT